VVIVDLGRNSSKAWILTVLGLGRDIHSCSE